MSRELTFVVHTAKEGHEITREWEVLPEDGSTLQHNLSSCSANRMIEYQVVLHVTPVLRSNAA